MSATLSLPASEADQAAKRAVRWRTVSWCAIAVAVVGLVALVAAARSTDEAALRNECEAHPQPATLACLDDRQPTSLTLEIAGSGARLSCQLRGQAQDSAPSLAERSCIEVRIDRLRHELRVVDAKVFIPLYVVMALLVSAWIRLGAEGDARRPALWLGWAIVIASVLLGSLDLRENSLALKLLAESEMKGALVPDVLARLDASAAAARTASLAKWGAAALWALTLAAGFFVSARSAEDGPAFRVLSRLSSLLLAAGAVLLAAGCLWGASADAFGTPVRLLTAGFIATGAGMVIVVAAMGCSRRLRKT